MGKSTLLNRLIGEDRMLTGPEAGITRDAIADAFGEEAYVVPELEATLRGFFQRRGAEMPEKNIKQATVIPSGEAIPNPRGTAPGWWVERDGKIVVSPTLLRRHAEMIASQRASVISSGFSTTTCLPALAAATAGSR